jgi:DNA-binding transcriptional MerR regulator
MTHKIAKLMLEQAETFLDRTKAIETAMSLGMPLNEIEEYLDWLDQTRDLRKPPSENTDPENPSGDNPKN